MAIIYIDLREWSIRFFQCGETVGVYRVGGRGGDGAHRDEFNTEPRRRGGRTEGLWPARLRRAGRIGQAARIQVVLDRRSPLVFARLAYSCRAQRGATGLQSRCLHVV